MEWRIRKMELYVGFLIGAGLMVFLALLIFHGGTKELFSSYTSLKTFLPRTYGLHEGSQIKMADLVIGAIKEITLMDDGRVMTELRINRKYMKFIRQDLNNPDLKKGSVIQLGGAEIAIGESFLEITIGAASFSTVPDNFELPFITKPSAIEQTIVSARELIDSIKDEKHSLGKMLHDQGAIYQTFQSMLKNIEETLVMTRKVSDELTTKVSKIIDRLASTEGALGAFINERKFYDELNKTLEQSRGILAQTGKNVEHLEVILKNLVKVTGQLPDVIGKADQAMSGANDAVDALKRHWLISSLLSRPEKDELLEITPR